MTSCSILTENQTKVLTRFHSSHNDLDVIEAMCRPYADADDVEWQEETSGGEGGENDG